jgi:two-component system, LytTR family, sensor kinase
MRTLIKRKNRRALDILMHPAVFISTSVLLSILFAVQEWVSALRMGTHISMSVVLAAWSFHYFLWGAILWSIWALYQKQIQNGSLKAVLISFLPLSIVISVLEEMAFLFVFVNLPVNHPHLGYWRRVTLYLYSELLSNLIIFWCGFFLFRGIGYYQRFRENEQVAAQLEFQLANARLSALRMQLNPHFLFNTMNGISSLMRVDIEAADRMLEQLSFLMRITIERGDAQLIPLRDEMDFIETYLAMQESRYKGRVVQSVQVAPELHEALVPTMLLQPIVENAFKHGLSKVIAGGELQILIEQKADHMQIEVRNNGTSLKPESERELNGHGVGLANVQSRLRLHYGDDFSFSIEEPQRAVVRVTIRLPIQFSRLNATSELVESA